MNKLDDETFRVMINGAFDPWKVAAYNKDFKSKFKAYTGEPDQDPDFDPEEEEILAKGATP